MRLFAIFFALIMLVPAAARGESYVSAKYGFSAEFPATPAEGEQQVAERDGSGNPISNSVMISAQVQGVYTALVTVETYTVPTQIDSAATLAFMVKGFVAQLDAKTTKNKPGKLEGKPARFFSYESLDKTASGSGMVVLVPSKKPRLYLVVNMHTPAAGEAEIAALDKFLASFQFE